MGSEFDNALPPVAGDGTSTPHPDPPQRSAPNAFDTSLPQTKDTQSTPPPILGTSWQTIVGNPQTYGAIAPPGMETISPDTASGILHGIREGIIDKPSEWLARMFSGSDEASRVAQANKAAADAARAAATDDPGGYSGGNTFGHVAGQTAVAGPALKVAGAVADVVPAVARVAGISIPRIAPLITGTAGETTPGLPGFVARTAAGGTSGALTGAGTAALSGDDPIRGMVEGGLFGGGISAGAQALQRAVQTLRGTYVPGEVRTGPGAWQASDETAQRANQAQYLTDQGVPVQLNQVNKDPGLTPAAAPWSGQTGDLGNQSQTYRKVALADVTGQGRNAAARDPNAPTLATGDQGGFLDAQGNRISGNFQAVAGRNNIDFGTNLAPQLTQLGTDLSRLDPDTQSRVAPFIRTVLQSVSRDPQTGQPIISGARYLDLTNSKSDLQSVASGDGLPAQYAQRLINMLHDGLSAGASHADQTLLAASRQQYRALKAVEAAAGPDGSFTPADLVSATGAQSKRYGGSQGTLDPLAKAGATVIQGQTGGLTGTGAAAGSGAAAAVPGAIMYGASHMAPGLLGAVGMLGLPAAGAAFGLPLALQAANRNPEAVARAIRTLQGGANFAPYSLPRQVVAPGVVATQQPTPFPYTNSNP